MESSLQRLFLLLWEPNFENEICTKRGQIILCQYLWVLYNANFPQLATFKQLFISWDNFFVIFLIKTSFIHMTHGWASQSPERQFVSDNHFMMGPCYYLRVNSAFTQIDFMKTSCLFESSVLCHTWFLCHAEVQSVHWSDLRLQIKVTFLQVQILLTQDNGCMIWSEKKSPKT